jgi:hypothetical protein
MSKKSVRIIGLGYDIKKMRKDTSDTCHSCREKLTPGSYTISKTSYAYRSCSTERYHLTCFKKELMKASRTLSPKVIREYDRDNAVMEI